jgi:hypothetical protein
MLAVHIGLSVQHSLVTHVVAAQYAPSMAELNEWYVLQLLCEHVGCSTQQNVVFDGQL